MLADIYTRVRARVCTMSYLSSHDSWSSIGKTLVSPGTSVDRNRQDFRSIVGADDARVIGDIIIVECTAHTCICMYRVILFLTYCENKKIIKARIARSVRYGRAHTYARAEEENKLFE